VRGVGVALDVDDLVILGVHELTTADRAVGTHAGKGLRLLDLQRGRGCFHGGEVEAARRDDPRRGGAAGFEEVTT
jgi:hypothetical protein